MSKTRVPRVRSLCVFCGSSPGEDPRHREAAARLGRLLAAAGVQLIYGGGHLGLMGVLAEAAMEAGGHVIGVIPEHLTHIERAFTGVSELHVVDSMHTRKRKMFDLADAFAVLPGGMGTMDETFEILTWKQLRLHAKPIIIVNQQGYWDPWLQLASHIIESGFASPSTAGLYAVVNDVDQVLLEAQNQLSQGTESESRLF